MQTNTLLFLGLCLCVTGCASPDMASVPYDAKSQVVATERAFAKTMADRNHRAFGSFIADDAIFFSGPTPLRGKQAVVDFWARFYTEPNPPFSWEPKDVEVLASGDLALSSGPVHDANGKVIATFTSIWRRTDTNTWKIVFDKGNVACNCANAP